jgi:K+-transporting ATPase ATPase A chain
LQSNNWVQTGGGFFGVNSAHPFENPTPLSNFLQMLAILLLPIACVVMFGYMIRQKKHGYAVLTAMFVIFLAGLILMLVFEHRENPIFGGLKNLEGKELRFGVTNSVLWGAATSAASNGSVNAMHDSFQALPGMVAMFNIMLGEVVFGGVGAGLYGMLTHVIITVFLAGLMVGRTPEYLGKKIEAREVKLAMMANRRTFSAYSRRCCRCRNSAHGPGQPQQQGAARTKRNSLRILFGCGK